MNYCAPQPSSLCWSIQPPPLRNPKQEACGTQRIRSGCSVAGLDLRVASRSGDEPAHAPHLLALQRARRERPRHHAAEQRDERAPFHSITSSASASSLSAIWKPSALAVLRLNAV